MSESKVFVDLSGYALTGKSAVTNILQEIEGFSVPDVEFEFGLFRMKDGLFDLSYALNEDWSPLRTDAAIRRFIKLIYILGNGYKRYSLRWLSSPSGYNYDKLINPYFLDISIKYINSLINDVNYCYWPFRLHDINSLDCFFYRVKHFLNPSLADREEKFVSYGDGFYEKTKSYLEELFSNDSRKYQVMNNAFEPFRSGDMGKYFSQCKCIIVDRDPRAIFAASKISRYSDFTDVDKFVRYFKESRKRGRAFQNNESVLYVSFEDLVLRYDDMLTELYTFLGIRESDHFRKGEYFSPDISIKNIDNWKRVLTKNEVAALENMMNE